MKKLFAVLVLTLPLFSGVGEALAEINPALIDVQDGIARPAPTELALDSYLNWVQPIMQQHGLESPSGFTAKVFEWYQNEKNRGLPAEVEQDPEHIYVNVARPLAETIELEEAGDITEGNTVGAEVYAEQSGTMKEALSTMLFRWGRPANAEEGKTHPPGGPFQKRVDYFAANADWGPGAYASLTMRRSGGLLKNLFDRYIVLIRGNDTDGYDVLMQYLKAGGTTSSENCFAIAILRPVGPNKVAYKISTRYQGQSYKILGGIKLGREKIGFNIPKVRAVQVESNGLLKELQDTGNIKDRNSDLEYGDGND